MEGTYPTLAPGGQTEGRLLVTPDVDALDAYEGVDRGLYARVSVPLRGAPVARDGRATGDEEGNKYIGLSDGKSAKERKKRIVTNKNIVESALTVELYVGDPDALSIPVPVSWPDGNSFAAQVCTPARRGRLRPHADVDALVMVVSQPTVRLPSDDRSTSAPAADYTFTLPGLPLSRLHESVLLLSHAYLPLLPTHERSESFEPTEGRDALRGRAPLTRDSRRSSLVLSASESGPTGDS